MAFASNMPWLLHRRPDFLWNILTDMARVVQHTRRHRAVTLMWCGWRQALPELPECMIAPFEMAHDSHVLACVPCWVKIFYAYMSFLHLVGRRLKSWTDTCFRNPMNKSTKLSSGICMHNTSTATCAFLQPWKLPVLACPMLRWRCRILRQILHGLGRRTPACADVLVDSTL